MIRQPAGIQRVVPVLAMTRLHPCTLKVTMIEGPGGQWALPDLVVFVRRPLLDEVVPVAADGTVRMERRLFRLRWFRWLHVNPDPAEPGAAARAAGYVVNPDMVRWGIDGKGRTPVYVEVAERAAEPAPAPVHVSEGGM